MTKAETLKRIQDEATLKFIECSQSYSDAPEVRKAGQDKFAERIEALSHAISLLEAEESRKCTVTTNTDRTVIPRRYYVVGQWYKGKESGIISWEREEPEPLNFSTIIRMRKSIAESQGYDMVIITNIIPLEAEAAAEKLEGMK